ncbi:oxygen-independent coproporphyrinogen-3 oxidase [Novosphingobium sp. SG916]|nr:oxygen-independent coproporphyrinogen-3 oxidase [Novosphingobium sp. SG919]NMN88925.1 oxygen-independent coproporphyrinogen-3 oxidase [Novosphingobium sp. SG916]
MSLEAGPAAQLNTAATMITAAPPPGSGERFADWTWYPELLARPVPRYTSYPTAAEFADADLADAQRDALAALKGPVSLYLHIPYCQEICWYCGCNTGAANRSQRLAGYLAALHREIELVAQVIGPQARITRIAFGGGSPNAISPTDFVRLIDTLTLNFRLARPVISLELDPRSLVPQWFTAIAGIGVIKASLGVQTFDPRVQAAIGRVQPQDDIARAMEGLRRAGVDSINFDLMYGLPHQDEAVLDQTLDTAMAMAPDRVALFGYAHVPHVVPRQRRIDVGALPGQRTRFAMAAQGSARLRGAGYEAIGFDHFALPGDDLAKARHNGTLRRNFQGFTDDTAGALIGLGASSVGMFPGLLVQNEKNAGRYRQRVEGGQMAGTRGLVQSADDCRRAALIETLLCQEAVDLPDDLLEDAREGLAPFVARGLARIEGQRLVLAPHSAPYHRSIAVLFDAYRGGGHQFSSAV